MVDCYNDNVIHFQIVNYETLFSGEGSWRKEVKDDFLNHGNNKLFSSQTRVK